MGYENRSASSSYILTYYLENLFQGLRKKTKIRQKLFLQRGEGRGGGGDYLEHALKEGSH